MGKYHDSLAYYAEAHRHLSRLRDTFGRAYAACGIANANRMVGRFDTAFTYFTKAKTLYGELRDRVSYAYTLWGEGTLYKVLGHLPKARKAFAKAEAIFTQTRDRRGWIYTCLGRGELLMLQGKRKQARLLVKKAWGEARRHGFLFEELHSELLLTELDRQEGKRVSFTPLRRRYRALGSTFPQEVRLPLNLP
jgi:tetratricopeptide (TPR) repeat protein